MEVIRKSTICLLTLLLVFLGCQIPTLHAAVNDYMSVTKSVTPTTITTEEEAEVTLSIKGTPPENVVVPNDVVLIIDKSGSMRPEYNNGEDKMTAAKEAAKGFIDLMDFTKHRVGIVDFSSTTMTRTFDLTTDATQAKNYVDTITANGATATGDAIDKAIAMLENHRPEARPVIVIMTDGDATEPIGNPYGFAKERAQAAKDAGIVFYTIALLKSTDNPDTSGPNLLLKEMATTADHHHFVLGSQGLKEIYAAIVKEIGFASAYDVTVKDNVSPDFTIVPGSYDNNIPKPEVNGNTLIWKFAELKNNTLTFKYKIKPKDPEKTGILPITSSGSVITYKDYAGGNRSKAVPNTDLQVTYPAPVITSVEPSEGPVGGGGKVTIRGDKFKPGATVKFGSNVASDVQIISKNEITATVPAGNQGKVTVTVTNPDRQKATAEYRYKADPVITSIQPNNGPLAGGNTVYFKGNYFMQGLSVKFGEKEAPVAVYTDSTYFRVFAPVGDVPGPVDVVLTNPDGTTITVAGGYTYNAPPVEELTVSEITPNTGKLSGGELIYLQGKKFDPAVKVYFGEKAAELVTYYSDQRVAVKAPAGDSAGPVDVKVVNPDGKSVTVDDGYTYKPDPKLPAPEITSVTPNSGLVKGGEIVSVKGNNFQSGAKVYFGSNQAEVRYSSSSQINVVVPASSTAGDVDVRVVNPDNQEAIKPQAYKYLENLPAPPPSITNISPSSGPMAGGTNVYIDGTGFVEGLKVFFGAVEAKVASFYGSTRIWVKSPVANVDGPVDVKIVNPDGQETVKTEGFTYIAPPPPKAPVITNISPSSGPISGGTNVYIDGTDFVQGLKVYFGEAEAQVVTFYNSTRIWVKSPVANVDGPVDVKIVNPDGQETVKTEGFTYIAPPPPKAPTITNITPTSGPTNGGTNVYIDGSDFVQGLKVYFGDAEAQVATFYNSTRLWVKSPATNISGPVDVKIVNPDGQETVKTQGFTYLAPVPQITSISPNSGPVAGGTNVYIDGANFVQGLKVYFGAAEAQVATFYNSTRIWVKSPASGVDGPVDVRIVNPEGTEGVKTKGFTYIAPPPPKAPTITNITPASGPTAGGTNVYIDGTDFAQGVKVYFGDTEAQVATYYNSTRLWVKSPAVSTGGPVDVKVVNPDGLEGVKAQGFTYIAPPPPKAPTITNITPKSGPLTGGTNVYIDGADFVQGLKVYFGNVEGIVATYYNSTRLWVKSPSTNVAGPVDVKIVNPDGQESNTILFEYK
jgi:uncharacterized protein YegL